MIQWHRLFGLTLTDFFTGSSYEVELEKDLSLRQQLLDVVIIEKKEGAPPAELPDGLDNMGVHNLMTYKSHQEALDAWTVDELMGHYVNYRKQISPSGNLLPEEDFRLYAVSTRYPEKLAEQVVLTSVSPGVYNVCWGVREIRVIVLSRIPRVERNAVWLLFSAVPENVGYGAGHYQWKNPVSTVIYQLFEKYGTGGVVMPYTIEDYQRDVKKEVMGYLTQEDIDELLKRLRPEDRLKGLKPEDRLRGLKPEDRLRLLAKGFSRAEIEKLLEKL
ncbi:MAG: hypothetical protein AB7S75_11005 [Desulfococcaceae bacterium]